RDAFCGVLHRGLDQLTVLVERYRGRLTRRAYDDDPGRAIADMKIDQLAEAGQVEGAAGLHRRRDRDKTSSEHREPIVQSGAKTAFYPIQDSAPAREPLREDRRRI